MSTSTSGAPARSSSRGSTRFLLYLLWASLAAWLTFAFTRGETFRNDEVALPVLIFFMTTAVLGSRLYMWLQETNAAKRGDGRGASATGRGSLGKASRSERETRERLERSEDNLGRVHRPHQAPTPA